MNCIKCIHCVMVKRCGPNYRTEYTCDLSSDKFIECTHDIYSHFEDKKKASVILVNEELKKRGATKEELDTVNLIFNKYFKL